MAHYRKKDDVIHKTGSTQRIAMTPEEDQAMAIGYTHKKFGKDRTCSSGDILVDKHTHTQTYSSQYLTTTPVSEVTMNTFYSYYSCTAMENWHRTH